MHFSECPFLVSQYRADLGFGRFKDFEGCAVLGFIYHYFQAFLSFCYLNFLAYLMAASSLKVFFFNFFIKTAKSGFSGFIIIIVMDMLCSRYGLSFYFLLFGWFMFMDLLHDQFICLGTCYLLSEIWAEWALGIYELWLWYALQGFNYYQENFFNGVWTYWGF